MPAIHVDLKSIFISVSRPLDGSDAGKFVVEFPSNIETALQTWVATTRISPIWAVKRFEPLEFNPLPGDDRYTGGLLFVGPIRPHDLVDTLIKLGLRTEIKHIYFSLGLFNTLVFLRNDTQPSKLIKEFDTLNVNWEFWPLRKGSIVEKPVHSNSRTPNNSWRTQLTSIAKNSSSKWLATSLQEYLPLSASTFARAEQNAPYLLPALESHLEIVSLITSSNTANENEEVATTVPYQRLSDLTHINAALSRFSSQAFSGTSPILMTECHFWTHSLLGTGIANLGLQTLVDFIGDKMGRSLIPERFEAYALRGKPVLGITKLDPKDERARKHYLDTVTPSAQDANLSPVRLLTYFSGRDGFKSNVTSLSVPLNAVAAANALPWTLLTLTHEMSHLIIHGVLSTLLPEIDDSVALQRSLILLKDPSQANNWLEDIRATFLCGLITLSRSNKDNNTYHTKLSVTELQTLLLQYATEITEVLVHVFDFMYFYGQEHDKYVAGIWSSWSVIPNISNRVPEYVIRTACALASKHLIRDAPEREAISQTESELEAILKSGNRAAFVQQALQYLRDNRSNLEIEVLARLPFIQIVHTFLYSPNIATDLGSDQYAPTGGRKDDEYAIRSGALSGDRFENPLAFVRAFTKNQESSATDSLMLWLNLALNVQASSPT